MNREVDASEIGRFVPEARRAIIFAGALGWSVRWTNQRKRVIVLRTEGKEITVPSTNVNANRARAWIDQIIKHTDRTVLEEFYSGKFADTLGIDIKRVTAALGASVTNAIAEELNKPVVVEAPKPLPAYVNDAKKKEAPVTAVQTEPDTVSVPTLVSTTPWLARRSGTSGGVGKVYESPNVIIETYSDGSVIYRCRHCRYTNDNPRSVAAHNPRKHPETKNSPHPVLRPVRNYQPTGLHREMSAARRLAADITAALDSVSDWHGLDASDLAKVLAERIIEARPEREPAEPLTDQQIIARITALVDGGRLADLHQQVEQATAALAEAEAARVEAEAKAEKWHGDLRAVREMLDETS